MESKHMAIVLTNRTNFAKIATETGGTVPQCMGPRQLQTKRVFLVITIKLFSKYPSKTENGSGLEWISL